MIKKFIRRVFRFGSGSEPKTVPKEHHGVGREAISQGSRKVCEVLHSHGYEAYVVGGAVRDLLLGLRPKDFDVATDAYPEEVHKIFRRSRLIGKRFKLVHVMFGEETVEVSTFRARTATETDEHGRVLRDNIYGTREDDAIRRDFTINALYYDPAGETDFPERTRLSVCSSARVTKRSPIGCPKMTSSRGSRPWCRASPRSSRRPVAAWPESSSFCISS